MEKYKSNPNFVKALEYIGSHDLASMENGTYQIDADNVYVNIVECEMRPQSQARLEVHDVYIDVQIPLSGPETFGVKSRSACTEQDGEMNTDNDIMFFNDREYDLKVVPQGEIVVFAPEDAHAPLIGEGLIRKAIFKVKVR